MKITVFDFVRFGATPAGAAAVFRGTHLLVDEAGSWTGTSTGLAYPDGSIDGQDVLIGRGAYEGLYAILNARAESAPANGGVTTWRGMIMPGIPPSAPSEPSVGDGPDNR
ncbi:MAG TPA: hypothetical protein VFV72_13540 [Candidatus Limnocylindrales bacterium]|nr:hypothetical protein [Candidatus Limnocylindrales bacterium]